MTPPIPSTEPSLRAVLVDPAQALDGELCGSWNALAAACHAPASVPEWMLGYAGTHRCDAACAAVYAGDELIGVLPFFRDRGRFGSRRLRLLAAPVTSGAEPLAVAGREDEVAAAGAALLASEAPVDVLVLEGVRSPDWARRLATHWPGEHHHAVHSDREVAEPAIALDTGGVEGWLERRSAKARHQLRRAERRLAAMDLVLRRTTTTAELDADLGAFLRLHRASWMGRGGSLVLTDDVERMLHAASPGLLASGALDLWSVEGERGIVFSSYGLERGGDVSLWLQGAEPALSKEPLMLGFLVGRVRAAVEDGVRRISLGPGDQDYKLRLTDTKGTFSRQQVTLGGSRSALALGEMEGERLRKAVGERISAERRAQLRRAARRLRPRA